MAQITCGGADVLRGSIRFPARGPWFADLALDTATEPTGKVQIVVDGGFTLSGAIVSGGVFCDVATVHVVGGAGGLGTIVPKAAYQGALLRDPLNAVLQAGGEELSSTVDQSILSVSLIFWSQVAQRASTAIDTLCKAAGAALGQAITWRVLDDGTVWLGAEDWQSASLPKNADLLDVFPSDGRYVIGCEAPALLPGVNLDGVGKVAAVDHWIGDEVRSWAWVVP